MLNRQQNQKKRDRKSKSACSPANATNQMSTSNSYSHSWQIYLFSKREHFGIIHACMYGNPFVPSAMVVVVAVTAYSIVIVVVVVDAVSALLFILSFNKMTWAYFHFFYRFLVDYYNAIDLDERKNCIGNVCLCSKCDEQVWVLYENVSDIDAYTIFLLNLCLLCIYRCVVVWVKDKVFHDNHILNRKWYVLLSYHTVAN